MIADGLNFNLRFSRGVEEVMLAVCDTGRPRRAPAAPGPRYGRIWNAEVVETLVERLATASPEIGVSRAIRQRITVDNGRTRPSSPAIETCPCFWPTRIGASSTESS